MGDPHSRVIGNMRHAAAQNKPVVLVVEDDYFVRAQAIAIIEEAGYEVIEAGNADIAIALLESRKDIRLVFTDIEMPGSMDGIKLARAIRNRWPPIELIVTSGRHAVDTNELPPGGKFLPKPYSFDVLVTAIRTLTG
jgi:CheY-like chemotaxis protein